jgi:hypothetical protein
MDKKNIFQLTENEMRIAYLGIQLLVQHGVNHGDMRPALNTDSLRASLRNALTKSTGLGGQDLQEYYEDNARFIASGKWDK